jgi:hypothetical protein
MQSTSCLLPPNISAPHSYLHVSLCCGVVVKPTNALPSNLSQRPQKSHWAQSSSSTTSSGWLRTNVLADSETLHHESRPALEDPGVYGIVFPLSSRVVHKSALKGLPGRAYRKSAFCQRQQNQKPTMRRVKPLPLGAQQPRCSTERARGAPRKQLAIDMNFARRSAQRLAPC